MMLKTACDRELVSFMLVAATVLLLLPGCYLVNYFRTIRRLRSSNIAEFKIILAKAEFYVIPTKDGNLNVLNNWRVVETNLHP